MKQSNTQNLLVKEDCILIVVDVQEKLMPVIADKEDVVNNIIRLLKFSQLIKLPVILTEQEKLGATLPEVKKEIQNPYPISKSTFGCFSCDEFVSRIRQIGKKTLILTGVETHVCVAQTALRALPDFKVHVVSDAVSSRTLDNRDIALKRMRQSGSIITSTEMLLFELLQKAGTDEFKSTLKLVK